MRALKRRQEREGARRRRRCEGLEGEVVGRLLQCSEKQVSMVGKEAGEGIVGERNAQASFARVTTRCAGTHSFASVSK
jgi:hypothetical protein